MALLPVDDARARILAQAKPLGAETVPLTEAFGRVLATAVTARRDQPPFDGSAMDGYAVRAIDLAGTPVELSVAGISAAGKAFRGTVREGEAIRIFTGAPLPRGADSVVIQENTEYPDPNRVRVLEPVRPGQHVRARGLDFRRGAELLPRGTRLNARDMGLAAAANAGSVRVVRRPRVALFTTGDELVPPGGRPRADQIVSSNSQALLAMARHFGTEAADLGIVPDTLAATVKAIRKARNADILLTTGGASVGDHDFVREGLIKAGVDLQIWKIAMRPGKPFMFGRLGKQFVLGLPGNPVSALVCARLFLKPLLDALQGLDPREPVLQARLGTAMGGNDGRQDYVRAVMTEAADGLRTVVPLPIQDSSMQRALREANCLIVRPPHAPAANVGVLTEILPLDF